MASSDAPPTRPALRRALPVALVVVIVAAAGVVAWAGSAAWARSTAERETSQLADVATEVALLLSSLSSADAAASLDRLEELSTGSLFEEVTARRVEVLEVLDDDNTVSAHAEVIASGVELPAAVHGVFGDSSGPATARLLIATRAEVSRSGGDSRVDADDGDHAVTSERTWRWRIEAVFVDGRALVSSAEVAV
ncbi:hypothetical protein [Dietzia aerolata]|uniref:Mammalian cell entry protein n=1 Tax=Dietzia aerolata TaxID=595984 RepID=A0ABV5JP45_9ACTN